MAERVDKHRRHGSRHRARRRAVEILFEAEARDADPVEVVAERVELARDSKSDVAPVAAYSQTIISGAAEELDAVDTVISRYLSDDWEIRRLPAVDRAVMRVSVWELLFNEEVPTPTAVVEGVELASAYSGEESSAYINAFLDSVGKDRGRLRAEFVPASEEQPTVEQNTQAATSDSPDQTEEYVEK